MKRFNFLSVAVIAVLMVFAVGCTTLQESAGGYEEMPRSRVYRQTPYGGNQVIVLERDPFTGQYYQVSPYGYYGTPYNDFGYGYPAYPRVYNRGGGGYYRGDNGSNARPTPAPRPQNQNRGSDATNRARDILKGN